MRQREIKKNKLCACEYGEHIRKKKNELYIYKSHGYYGNPIQWKLVMHLIIYNCQDMQVKAYTCYVI